MKQGNVWKGIGLGSLAAFLTVVISAAVFAWMVGKEMLGMEYLNVCAAAALILGGTIAGLSGGRGADRWVRACLAGAGLLLLLLTVNLIGYDGSLGGIAPCSVLVMGSAAAMALISGGRKREKRRKYQIKKYRTG